MKGIHDKPYHKKVHKRATINFKILIGHGGKKPKHAKKGGPFKLDPPKRRSADKLSAPPAAVGLEEDLLSENQTDLDKLEAFVNQAAVGDWIKIIPKGPESINPPGPGDFCVGWKRDGGYKITKISNDRVQLQVHVGLCKGLITGKWNKLHKPNPTEEISKMMGTIRGALSKGGRPVVCGRNGIDCAASMAKIGTKEQSLRKWLDEPLAAAGKAIPSHSPVGQSKLGGVPNMVAPKDLKGPLYSNRVLNTIKNSVGGVNAAGKAAVAVVGSNLSAEQKEQAVIKIAKGHAKTTLPSEFYSKPETKKFIENYADFMGRTLKNISAQKDKKADVIQYEKDMAGYTMALVGTMAAYMMEVGYSASSVLPDISPTNWIPQEWKDTLKEIKEVHQELKGLIRQAKAMLPEPKDIYKKVKRASKPLQTDLSTLSTPELNKNKYIVIGDEWINEPLFENDILQKINGKGYELLNSEDAKFSIEGEKYTTPASWPVRINSLDRASWQPHPDYDKIGLVVIALGSHVSNPFFWAVGSKKLLKRINKIFPAANLVWATASDKDIKSEGLERAQDNTKAIQGAVRLQTYESETNLWFIDRLLSMARTDCYDSLQPRFDMLYGADVTAPKRLLLEYIKFSIIANKIWSYDKPGAGNIRAVARKYLNQELRIELFRPVTGFESAADVYAILINAMARGLLQDGVVGYNNVSVRRGRVSYGHAGGLRKYYTGRGEWDQKNKKYAVGVTNKKDISAAKIVTENPINLPRRVTYAIEEYEKKFTGKVVAELRELFQKGGNDVRKLLELYYGSDYTTQFSDRKKRYQQGICKDSF